MVTRAWSKLHVFPRLELVTCFPALYVCLIHVFLRLERVACFPALKVSYMFSRSFEPVACFPGLNVVACFVWFITPLFVFGLIFQMVDKRYWYSVKIHSNLPVLDLWLYLPS